MEKQNQRTMHMNSVTVVADDKRVMAEIDISGTHNGEFDNKPAFGYKFSIRGVFVIDFDKGNKIAEFRTYYDSGILNRYATKSGLTN